ncbi:dephospho-CoA kinase [Flavobacterium sp.]|uniref:dephospho-CoA kinase n=1 Tax=Flavobacterium sp. TaxID=239 RepID=UPI00286B3A9B|nr:dephospho-CoA kinase [Flavobacterium sp.]
MTKIIGLTGGIGSGKTTIARLFESENIPVYIADIEAKKIMQFPETINQIAECFGNDAILNNQVNTKYLSQIVFENPKELEKLNSIIHPLVKLHFEKWVKKQKTPFVIKESAILFESGSYKYCDKIITVFASEETRILRVMLRDKLSKDEVQQRIKNQWSDVKKISMSDYTIENESVTVAKKRFDVILKILKILY